MTDENQDQGVEQHIGGTEPRSNKSASIVQKLGALAITLIALWYLFGIPGYILFEKFLGETVSGASDSIIEQTTPE